MLDARAAAAERIFAALPPSHRHEYLRWIGEAKRTETRRRRATKAAEMMVDKHGEARHSLP
ncbi:YdeI/OmpD-associated family protein [Actinomyces oris]|uniref:YdeI/OmpD-associated family protein n=1 Tax=Actinomyces oris TaxID=544580 RepID=UPI002852BCBA|nr:YdeI/OmpD-associated family protein [Actinomyces oris]